MPHANLNYLRSKTSRFDVIDAIMKDKAADLILEHGMLVNVYTREVYQADIAVYGDRIGFVGDTSHLEAKRRVNVEGRYITPGIMDGHLHIDSCMVNVTNYAKGVLPMGITSVFIDSHEIGNALGMDGVAMMVNEGKRTPLRVFQYVPAQVPCGDPENQTPNFQIGLEETKQLFAQENVFGLGEVSKYKVVNLDPGFVEKIDWMLRQDGIVDGSAHDFTGKNLQAYVASGIFADHESFSKETAWERARNGLTVMMRNGSTQKDVDKCVLAITENGLDTGKFCFCSDDRHPVDLVRTGSIDECVRIAVEAGIDPAAAIQMASLNCARNFRLDGELGGIAPGKLADLLVVDDLSHFTPRQVYVGGELVAENGKMVAQLQSPPYQEHILHSFSHVRRVTPQDMALRLREIPDGEYRFNIIRAMPGNIWSNWETDTMPVNGGLVAPDTDRDILKVIVVERYGRTEGPNIGRALIRGFGFQRGAIAQSLAQDIHDIVAVGVDDADLALAINRVIEMNGGIVAVCGGKVLGDMDLPIGGLMCDRTIQDVAARVNEISRLTRVELGGVMQDPHACLQFQTHPMIPYLKISDIGLMDVNHQKIISLLAEC
ncbi:adenine deaminase [Oscillospiraceae bacterium]|nr:adenine deaminase [Oscillospiraceae bacterium]BDF75580.1 adenine deaminase [Oscillospiraceae bacterium]